MDMGTRHVRNALAAVLLVLGMSLPALAQSAAAREGPEKGTSSINVDRLPLDLGRIHRELKRAPEDSEVREGLRLRYFLQIYGTAPELRIFSETDDLIHGPVPYGGPTHREMLNVMTPQEFRAPPADFSGLLRWVSEKLSKKSEPR